MSIPDSEDFDFLPKQFIQDTNNGTYSKNNENYRMLVDLFRELNNRKILSTKIIALFVLLVNETLDRQFFDFDYSRLILLITNYH